MIKLTIFTDGASRGNPGPASYGFSITNEKGEVVYEEGKYIGMTTNNVAEYSAVLESIKYVAQNYEALNVQLVYFMDSKLVCEQLSGRYKINSPSLFSLAHEIRSVMKEFSDVKFNHVYREKNKIADRLANIALDKEFSK